MAVEKDKGWSWAVSVGVFVAMLLETGIVKALGVLLPTLRQQFSTHTWVIGLVVSLVPGLGAFTCPLAGALSKRFSPRCTTMTFGLLAALGVIAGSFAPSVHMLVISLVLASFSMGSEVVMMGELAHYFDTYFDVANAIGQSGVGIGIIIMPLLTQFFLDIYGWRGAVLLIGGLSLHFIVCGALLRPVANHQANQQYDVNNDVIETPTCSRHNVADTQQHSTEQRNTSIVNISYYFDLILFSDVNFLSLIHYSVCSGYCFAGWLIYIVPHGESMGFQPYQASILATAGGIGHLVGSIAYPAVKTKCLNQPVFYGTTCIVSLALATDPILSAWSSYVGLVLSSAAFGLGKAMGVLSMYKLAKDTLAEEKMPSVIIWINVSYSVGTILSGFLSGWIYDETGNYTASFLILCASSLLGVFPQLILDIRKNRMKYAPVPPREMDN